MITYHCPKCGRWHPTTACNPADALALLARLLSDGDGMATVTLEEEEQLRRYRAGTGRDQD
jgi:hypothetical protein